MQQCSTHVAIAMSSLTLTGVHVLYLIYISLCDALVTPYRIAALPNNDHLRNASRYSTHCGHQRTAASARSAHQRSQKQQISTNRSARRLLHTVCRLPNIGVNTPELQGAAVIDKSMAFGLRFRGIPPSFHNGRARFFAVLSSPCDLRLSLPFL